MLDTIGRLTFAKVSLALIWAVTLALIIWI